MDEGKKVITVRTEKMQEQLKEWGLDLEKLKARANQARSDVKIEIDREVSRLRERLNEGQRNLEELKSQGAAASTEIRKGAENAWAELTKAFDSAKAKFK
jgi:chromosome segregation ATPase